MTLTRRLFIAATGAVAAGTARAAGYPSDTIKIIVPRAPGGGTDNLVRLMQPGLEKKLGVSLLIDNKPDAAAIIGAALVAKAKPDGYTFLLADNALYQNPAIVDSLPYDTLKDFSAVTMVAQGPVILIVHPDVPAKNLQELIALAKKTDLSFASGGIGASTHLVGVMVNLKAGTKILHVPFKGSGPALNALLGGHVSMQYGGINSAAPYVKAGKVRAIAVTGTHRDPSMPDVPTLTEAGLAGADVTSVGHACAARDADRDPPHHARCDRRGAARSRARQEARRIRLRTDRQHARAAPGADCLSGQPVDRGRQDRES